MAAPGPSCASPETTASAALPLWNHFYNWHLLHHGISLVAPMARLSISRKNLLTLHI